MSFINAYWKELDIKMADDVMGIANIADYEMKDYIQALIRSNIDIYDIDVVAVAYDIALNKASEVIQNNCDINLNEYITVSPNYLCTKYDCVNNSDLEEKLIQYKDQIDWDNESVSFVLDEIGIDKYRVNIGNE